jgi:hypothetical protein
MVKSVLTMFHDQVQEIKQMFITLISESQLIGIAYKSYVYRLWFFFMQNNDF